MSKQQKPLKGYNPNKQGKAFNEDYGRKVFTETMTDISSEQNLAQKVTQAKLIEQIRKELSNE